MKIPHPICWKGCFSPQHLPPPCLFVMTGDFCQSSGHPIPTSTLLIHRVALTLWTSIILIDSRIETLVPEHQTSATNPNKTMRRPQRRWNISSMEGFYIFFRKNDSDSKSLFLFSRFISEFNVQCMDRLGIDQGDQQSQKKVISELKKITSTVQHSTCGFFSVRQGATWVVVDLCWRSSVEGICAYPDLGIPGDSKVWIEIPERNPSPNPSIGSGPCIKILMIHHGMSHFFLTLRGSPKYVPSCTDHAHHWNIWRKKKHHSINNHHSTPILHYCLVLTTKLTFLWQFLDFLLLSFPTRRFIRFIHFWFRYWSMLTKDRILRSLKPPDIPGSGGTHVRRWNGGATKGYAGCANEMSYVVHEELCNTL